MNKLTYTTAIFMAMAATSVLAHHPSADMSPNFEAVDTILADTPHSDMDIYDMGATTAAGDSINAVATQQSAGGVTTAREQAQSQTGDDPGMDAAAAAGTMELME